MTTTLNLKNKKINCFLKNGFRFEGLCLEENDLFLVIKEQSGKRQIISNSSIERMEVKN